MSAKAILHTVPPGGTLGILGGGQLGRMLAMAAANIGLDVVIYAPEKDTPAGRTAARSWQAGWDNASELTQFAAICDVITFEFENVPAATVEALQLASAHVFPRANALAMSQDRLVEKDLLARIGVPPADYAAIDGPDDIAPALKQLGGKGVLKSRREGYDGKGQARLKTGDDPVAAWKAIGERPAILEAFVSFEREISVVLARGQDGSFAVYDPPENDHGSGILKSSVVPASISDATRADAVEKAKTLAHSLDYVGVLALELFVMPDGSLLANEFAPRVHNSGHWTEDACLVGQFEQHVRAVCGWPLGPTDRNYDLVMENLLGDDDVARWRTLASDGALVRVYGKRGGGEGRKLGHAVLPKR